MNINQTLTEAKRRTLRNHIGRALMEGYGEDQK